MNGPIVSREAIAQHAEAAAAAWVANPSAAHVPNPYDEFSHPEHHAQWRIAFESGLLAYSAETAVA